MCITTEKKSVTGDIFQGKITLPPPQILILAGRLLFVVITETLAAFKESLFVQFQRDGELNSK